MQKRYISRIAKFFAVVIPVAIVVLISQHYLFSYADPNTMRIHDFYNEEKNSLDVVFIGASELPAGFSPAHAYEKYGFTSYLYAMDSNPASLYKAQLKEVLKRQDPQLIFVEVHGFLCSEDDLAAEARLRMFTESIPMSFNKLDTIFRHPYKDKLSCLLPFIKYHGEWANREELTERFQLKTYAYDEPSLLKGMLTCAAVDKQETLYSVPLTNETLPNAEMTEACLIDFLEYCKQEQLDNLVFVRFPHKFSDEYTYDTFFYANRAGELAVQYGYPFMNLEQKAAEIGIDYMTDFYNGHHMNVYGQMKLTDYLGDLIMNQYHLTPIKQTEKNKAHWEECIEYKNAYYEFADERIRIGDEYWVHEKKNMMRLLENIKITQSEQVTKH